MCPQDQIPPADATLVIRAWEIETELRNLMAQLNARSTRATVATVAQRLIDTVKPYTEQGGERSVNNASNGPPASALQLTEAPNESSSQKGRIPVAGLDKSSVNYRDESNKFSRSQLYNDITLIFMLENMQFSAGLLFNDIKGEFTRLGVDIKDSALLSRLSRMRTDGALLPISKKGGSSPQNGSSPTGRYKLSEGGIKAALAARRQRGMKDEQDVD
jgi:hypothetical protein